MGVPHGFKAAADRIAVGLRHQMGLSDSAPIDVEVLAARLRIAVVPLSSFATRLPQQVEQLVERDVGAFSASLLDVGGTKAILVNDGHSPHRRNSNVAHEIAHMLLVHPPQPFDHLNGRTFNQGVEAEANCLAGHILVPNAAALHIVLSGGEASACDRYGVSRRMLEWRLGASGARIRHQRWQRRRAARATPVRPRTLSSGFDISPRAGTVASNSRRIEDTP